MPVPQRRPRLRLDPKLYSALRQRVLNRDGWRCQRCASLQNLEVHHVHARSFLGDDAKENLITLCSACHRCHHGRRLETLTEDV
jgi:5-methylcytosine-specific restriction endonuclease McrA